MTQTVKGDEIATITKETLSVDPPISAPEAKLPPSPERSVEARRKPGPPKGTPGKPNNLRHGADAKNIRLTLSEAPAKYIRQTRQARHFRQAIENAVIERHGQIDLPRAALIESASLAFLKAMMTDSFLRHNEAKMTMDQWLAFNDRAIKFRQARDKAIADLRIDSVEPPSKSAIDSIIV